MLNNLENLVKSKKLEVEGLSLLHQAELIRNTDTTKQESKDAAATEYRGLKEPDIQEIRTIWKALITDPAVQAHIAEKKDSNDQEYISKVLSPHLHNLRPKLYKLMSGIRSGIEDVLDKPSYRTVTLNNADRFISDIFPELQQVLSSPRELSSYEMSKLITIRRRGVVESLIGMAEQLLAASKEQDPTIKAKLLDMDSLLEEYVHQAIISDTPSNRLVFASTVSTLDKVANELQSRGLNKLAAEIDVVSNTLDKTSVYNISGPGRSPDEIDQDRAVTAVDDIDYALKQTASPSIADHRTPMIRFLEALSTPASMKKETVLYRETLVEDLVDRLNKKDSPLNKYMSILTNSKESGSNYKKEQEEITKLLQKIGIQGTEVAQIILAPS